MTDAATKKVASVVLKEVPLQNVANMVNRIGSDAACGTGCGAGCGNNCHSMLDQYGHILDPATLAAGTANKAALLKEVAAQASRQLQSMGH